MLETPLREKQGVRARTRAHIPNRPLVSHTSSIPQIYTGPLFRPIVSSWSSMCHRIITPEVRLWTSAVAAAVRCELSGCLEIQGTYDHEVDRSLLFSIV